MIKKILLLVLCALNIKQTPKCRLNTRYDFREPLPVILRNNRILEPNDADGNVDIYHGESLTLSCEGVGTISHPNTIRDMAVSTITCDSGEGFRNDDWLNGTSHFSGFRCSIPPNYNSHNTDRTCYGGHRVIEVGYNVQNEFYPVYETCFNEAELHPIYSKYTQKPYNARYQTRVDRPFFKDNNNYPSIPVESLFSPHNQKSAVAKQIGSNVESYFIKHRLSRGHLAAKTDFVFAFTERSTFHYVNCAPQWESFNGGNWNTLEVDLRDHVHNAGYDTIVYTGTFGVMELRNSDGRKIDIHLYTDENNNPVIRVPKYFYKVIHDVNLKLGTAFVGINNPYYTLDEARSLTFCEDVCKGNFRWLSWRPDNPNEGYTFCCSIPDFRRTVDHLPHFEVKGLLP